MKNRELSFHQFPRESSLKEAWLNLVGIQKQPLESHKICSLHFRGGKKVSNLLPTTPMSSYRQTNNSSESRKCSGPKISGGPSTRPETTDENTKMNEL